MRVLVLPDAFFPVPADLIDDWRRAQKAGNLIPWSVADIYFRTPDVHIDCTKEPPVLGPWNKELRRA
jgi:hypothetical protein